MESIPFYLLNQGECSFNYNLHDSENAWKINFSQLKEKSLTYTVFDTMMNSSILNIFATISIPIKLENYIFLNNKRGNYVYNFHI